MSRDDADFAAYLAARWPTLVRTLVLLGLDQHVAEGFAVAGFARCHAAWNRMRREDDLDTQVFAAVQQGLGRHDRLGPTRPAPEDPVRLAMEAELDRIGMPGREVLVLARVAGFDEVQIAELLDVSVAEVAGRGIRARAALDLTGVSAAAGYDDRRLTIDEAFRMAAEAIEVEAAPYDAILARDRDARRRRTRLTAGAVVVAVLVVGGLTWAGTRSGDEPEPDDGPPTPASVTRDRNPVDVAWYRDGVLHLDRVSIELPHLTDLVEVDGGAVYAATDGTVAFVETDGHRRLLGHKADAGPLVGSRESGWVAWVDSDAGLVVDDVYRGVAASPSGKPLTDVIPVAIDQETVYYRSDGQTFGWKPRDQAIVSQPPLQLVDIEAGTRVYQLGTRIDLVQPFFSVDFKRPGLGAQLSPGGLYVLSQQPGGDLPLGAYRPLLYNVRTGVRVPTGLGPGEVALDATFGDNGSIVYVVARAENLEQAATGDGEPLGVLRTCTIDGRCTDATPLRLGGGEPLLAH